MAILNLEYYTQKDLYSDGDIEEQMLKMAKEGVTCEELSSEQVSFPVIYHFSDLRANILNWYPIKKSDSVLEIGAGCGAITGTLCEKAGQVTRPNHVKAKFYDLDMNEWEVEGEGLMARCICHELDHLDGHMYTEKVEGGLHDVNYEEPEEE